MLVEERLEPARQLFLLDAKRRALERLDEIPLGRIRFAGGREKALQHAPPLPARRRFLEQV